MKTLAHILLTMLTAWIGIFATPAVAVDSNTYFSDLPLRTKNRAKPNILMMLDNGQQSQRTYAPESFPDNLFPNIRTGIPNTSLGMAWRGLNKNNRSSPSYISWNQDSMADTDWHYRSSGTGCSGTDCLSKFNRLYFDPNFDYNAYRPAIPQGGSTTPTNILTPWEIVSAAGAMPLSAALQAQLYGCTGTVNSSCASSISGTCAVVWQRCAWLDGFNASAGTVDLASGFSTAPYPPFANQVAPSSWQNWSSSATSAPWPSGNALNWNGLFSPSVATTGTVLTGRSPDSVFSATWKRVPTSGTPLLSAATTWNSSLCPAPGTAPSASLVCDEALSSGNSCTYCLKSNCSQPNATSPFACATGTGTALPGRPTSIFSPSYCDTRYVDTSKSDGYAWVNPCLALQSGADGPFSNPGEADFFDADYDGKTNRNGRHNITSNGDRYFGNNPNMGVGGNQANNIRNFVLWHSFFRTRLLAQKSALAYSVSQSGLNSNFRVGLATLVNGQQTGLASDGDGGAGTGDQITFGAYAGAETGAENYHYFSAVSEFNTTHQAEWYKQLAKIQPDPFSYQPDTLGTLHGLYLWFVGRRADPSVPASYLSQNSANTDTAYNTGAVSQFQNVQITNTDRSTSLVTLAPARTGPFLYSCQNNIFTYLTSNWIGSPTTNRYNLQSDDTYGIKDTYPTVNASQPAVAAAKNIRLPSYASSICDPTAFPSDSGKNCATISNTAAGASAGSNPWPYPLNAPANAYYVSTPSSSFADLALFYWSQDLNEQFNRSSECVAGISSNHCIATNASNGSTKQGVKPFGSYDTVATWPHVTTNIIAVGINGSKSYTDASDKLIRPSAADQAKSSGSLYQSGDRYNASSNPALDYYNPWGASCVETCTDPNDDATCTTTCTRPPSNVTSYDDMVQAAIAGHGNFTSAHNVSDLKDALGSVWKDILALSGSESAVAVANTQVSQTGTSYAFQSSYNTSGWWGDLVASPIQPTTGIISTYRFDPVTCQPTNLQGWSALCQLRNTLCTGYLSGGTCTTPGSNHVSSRIIVTDKGDGSASPNLGQAFTSGNFGSDTRFDVYGGDASNVIAYLRGDSANETCGSGATTGYRCRFQNGSTVGYWNPIGDVVDAEAVVVGPPQTTYGDQGYGGWKASVKNRAPVVFQGANDGMLHAFKVGNGGSGDSTRGTEAWAYIPSFVLPNLKNLASQTYSHQYYVNATPAFGDVDFTNGGGTDWRTLLVGGLGKGGRGYYALDVTTPTASSESNAASKVLWTFPNTYSSNTACPNTQANMGYSYGRPALVKVKNGATSGQWVALVASGYDNGSSTGGDGKGHLYMLDAKTGTCIKDIATSTGDSTTPTGLAYFAVNVADPTTDQTVQAVYGGDLLGNVWKFGPTDRTTSTDISTWTATKFAVLKDVNGKVQPITAEPNIAIINSTPVVYIGTGQYLGTQDVPTNTNYKADPTTYVGQSVYALADTGAINYASTSARSTITALADSQTSAATYVINGDCTDNNGALTPNCKFGPQFCTVQSALTRCFDPSLQTTLTSQTTIHPWLFDLPAGERIITSPLIVLGALMFTSNQPISDPCQPGGKSYFYMLNYKTGGSVSGSGFVSQTILDPLTGDNVMASRPTVIQLPDGRVVGLVSTSVGATLQIQNILSQPARRTSWREVPNF
jgi:Tfp pilus tip-associated adhesin PilY1